MKSKLLTEEVEKTFVLVFDTGEEVASGLKRFCREQNITAAHLTAIGAFRDVTLGWFNIETKDYEKIRLDEQVEVLSLLGNVAVHKDAPKIHAHLVVGKRDGTAHGGHLLEAHVRPTLEVMLVESPVHLRRVTDEATGLALIDPDAPVLPPRRGRDLADET
jgi:hypothetical protein